MRRCIVVVLALLVVLSSLTSVFAAMDEVNQYSNLYFSGKTAYIDAYVSETGSSCSITAKLYRGSLLITTWSDSGTGSASVSGHVLDCTPGQTYILHVEGTVNGSPVSFTDVIKNCP